MAQLYDTVMVSAGQRGVQVTLSPEDLRSYVEGKFVSLV
jgi:Cys-tRNA(Pro)/Cys-tRNA(Cys) deacylase